MTDVVPVFGTDGCSQNVKAMLCGWTCGTDQGKITNITAAQAPDYISNVTIFADVVWATNFLNSCKDHCIPLAGGVTVSQRFSDPGDFVAQFNSANDPQYMPGVAYPRLFYVVGLSPYGGNFNGTNNDGQAFAASGSDLTGCQKETETSQSNANSFCWVLLVLAVLSVLA